MAYIAKIKLNDSNYEVEQVINEDNAPEGQPYISNVTLKESTSINERMTLGGNAANSLYFDFTNPISSNLDGVKVNLFIKPDDTVSEDEEMDFTDEEIDELVDSFNEVDEEPVDEEAEQDMIDDITVDPDIDLDVDTIDDIFAPPEGADIEEEPEEEEVYDEENQNTRDNLVITYDDDPEAPIEDEPDETGVIEDDSEPEDLGDWVNMGIFYISKITELKENTYRIEALDGFAFMNDEFDSENIAEEISNNTLTFGVVYEQLQAQLSIIDIGMDDIATDIYADLPIKLDFKYTLRELAGYLAGFLGCYATFNRFGNLEFRNYTVNSETLEDEETGVITVVNESIAYSDLRGQGVRVKTGGAMIIDRIDIDTDITVMRNALTINSVGDSNTSTADGVTIEYENPFMTQEVLNTIVAPQYMNLAYMPGKVECVWNPGIETGDILDVYYNMEDTYKMLATNISIKFDAETTCVIDSLGNTNTSEMALLYPEKRRNQRTYEDITGKLSDAIQDVSKLITGNEGGNVVLNDTNGDGFTDEILIMDNPEIEKATQIWRWNKAGLGFATSYNGNYATAITNDGHIVGNMVDVIDTSADGSTDPYVYLGSNTSDFGLRLTNREVQFVQRTTQKVLARLTSNALILEDTDNDNYIQFGGYAFYPTENGHLSLTRKKEE